MGSNFVHILFATVWFSVTSIDYWLISAIMADFEVLVAGKI